MNNRSQIEILNYILESSLNKSFSSMEALQKTSVGRKAIGVYNRIVSRTLSRFPWPFAHREEVLQQAAERPKSRWSFYYNLPPSYGHAWDLFSISPNITYPTTYAYQSVTPFFSDEQFQNIAVLEGPYVATNLASPHMLYTIKNPPIQDWSEEFVTVVEAEGAIMLGHQSNIEVRKLQNLERYWTQQKKAAQTSQSMALPRRTRVQSRALSNVLGRP